MSEITEEAQSLNPDARVTLFELDARSLGDNLYHFCSEAVSGSPVTFGGTPFTPIPIEVSGFQWSGQGAPPRPKLSIANKGTALQALTRDAKGAVGAILKRVRTFRRFLDDGATPDSTAIFTADIYRINQMLSRTSEGIEWELAPAIDQPNRKLPRRVCLRDYCSHRYRVWDPSTNSFNYSKATCPYVGVTGSVDGGPFFDRNGDQVANPALDVCSKKLETGCKPRFYDQQAEGHEQGVLPTRAFPGMAQYR